MPNQKPNHMITPAMMVHTAFQNRENGFFHTSHEDESAPFFLMVSGETERMLEAMRSLWRFDGTGKLSENPLQNVRYLFVSTVTRACRFCIQGGMDPTDAFNASDLYIRKMDVLNDIDEIWALREDMMTFYSDAMREIHRKMRLPLSVIRTMDYVEAHLHEKQSLEEIAEYAGLAPAYLSDLFHRETGLTLSSYILKRRIEAAKNMLRFSDQKVAEIAEILAFSNASHFHRVFKQETGQTPSQYRRFADEGAGTSA